MESVEKMKKYLVTFIILLCLSRSAEATKIKEKILRIDGYGRELKITTKKAFTDCLTG